jgi:hypothetical protein
LPGRKEGPQSSPPRQRPHQSETYQKNKPPHKNTKNTQRDKERGGGRTRERERGREERRGREREGEERRGEEVRDERERERERW